MATKKLQLINNLNGIQSVEPVATSTEDSGTNIHRITMTNGSTYDIAVQNGSKGNKGDKGDPGKSAYEFAQDGGYTGTKEEFDKKLATEWSPTKVVSGTGIAVSDASGTSFAGMKVFGKTEQVTTSGVQLLPINDGTYTIKNVTCVINNGVLTLNGTCTSAGGRTVKLTDDFTLSAGTYCLTGLYMSGDLYVRPTLSRTSDDTSIIAANNMFTLDENTQVYFGVNISEGTFNNVVCRPMLNEGNIALPWEPYTGGVPSPSPAYPQELESRGKWWNLLPPTTSASSSGVVCTVNADGSLEFSGVTTGGYNYYVCESLHLPAGTYTIAWNDENFVGGNLYVYSNTQQAVICRENGTFTITDSNEIVIYVNQSLAGTTISGKLKPMLNEGSTALPWRPYTGQKEIETVVTGKNLLKDTNLKLQNATYDKSTGTITGVSTANTATPSVKVQKYNYNTYVSQTTHITTAAEYSLEFIKTSSFNRLAIGTNGSNQDELVYFYVDNLVDGQTYYLNLNVEKIAITGSVISGVNISTEKQTEISYEPYNGCSMISPVSSGLCGIPVTDPSLANYTDENGQMWCCDEKDYERGKKVQRVGIHVFDGTETNMAKYTTNSICYQVDFPNAKNGYGMSVCSHFKNNRNSDAFSAGQTEVGIISDHTSVTRKYFTWGTTEQTIDDFKAFLAEQYANGTPVTVQYILETPIETDLTADEIAQYKALHTNKPNAVIQNDCDAHMEVEYYTHTYDGAFGKVMREMALLREQVAVLSETLTDVASTMLE